MDGILIEIRSIGDCLHGFHQSYSFFFNGWRMINYFRTYEFCKADNEERTGKLEDV
jgi:hypothetical protein